VELVDDLVDRVVAPVAGVREQHPRRLGDTRGGEFLACRGDHRFGLPVSSDSLLISAASTIWPSPTSACAL
jgi:hypothetical protein